MEVSKAQGPWNAGRAEACAGWSCILTILSLAMECSQCWVSGFHCQALLLLCLSVCGRFHLGKLGPSEGGERGASAILGWSACSHPCSIWTGWSTSAQLLLGFLIVRVEVLGSHPEGQAEPIPSLCLPRQISRGFGGSSALWHAYT